MFENTGYLEHLYDDLFKKQYLPEAGNHSYVLTYDWSEGGDTEVVVEDIDRMGHAMDYHDKYDKQQLDWRLLTEDNFGQKRYMYTGAGKMKLLHSFDSPHWFADEITLTTTEAQEQDRSVFWGWNVWPEKLGLFSKSSVCFAHVVVQGEDPAAWQLEQARLQHGARGQGTLLQFPQREVGQVGGGLLARHLVPPPPSGREVTVTFPTTSSPSTTTRSWSMATG